MPSALVSVDIRAASEDVFDLVHDYERRLEWDPFLREARLLEGAQVAEVGASARCVARRRAGGVAMETVYVSYARPKVAAVVMTRGPWFMRLFAASIRHDPINDEVVRVTYRYHFKTSPNPLALLMGPVVQMALHRETRRRLLALKEFVEATPATPAPSPTRSQVE